MSQMRALVPKHQTLMASRFQRVSLLQPRRRAKAWPLKFLLWQSYQRVHQKRPQLSYQKVLQIHQSCQMKLRAPCQSLMRTIPQVLHLMKLQVQCQSWPHQTIHHH